MQATRTTAEHRWRCKPSHRGCGVERWPALRYPLAGAVWTTAPTRGPSELRQRGCAQRSAAARPHCALEAVSTNILGCCERGCPAQSTPPGPARAVTAPPASIPGSNRHRSPYLDHQTREKALDLRILDLIARIIGFCTPAHERGRGHPPTETVRVLATLRQFLREGTPWRSLRATAAQASGSTLRRYLEQWAQGGLLAQVHAVLV